MGPKAPRLYSEKEARPRLETRSFWSPGSCSPLPCSGSCKVLIFEIQKVKQNSPETTRGPHDATFKGENVPLFSNLITTHSLPFLPAAQLRFQHSMQNPSMMALCPWQETPGSSQSRSSSICSNKLSVELRHTRSPYNVSCN